MSCRAECVRTWSVCIGTGLDYAELNIHPHPLMVGCVHTNTLACPDVSITTDDACLRPALNQPNWLRVIDAVNQHLQHQQC